MPRNYCRDNKQVFSESLDCGNVQGRWQRNKGPWLLQNTDLAVGEYAYIPIRSVVLECGLQLLK
jgi:hypothetical protein